MLTNLIKNPNFTEGSANWSTYVWYPENKVEFLNSGGQSGACVKCTVRSIGDPGQSTFSQAVMLKVGKEYTIELYAKRKSNVDVWLDVHSSAGRQGSPSMLSRLPDGGGYTKISYTFTAKGSSNIEKHTIRILAGSAGGEAWFDSVRMMGEEVEDDGNNLVPGVSYVADVECSSAGLKLRKNPSSGSEIIGYWPNGRLGVVEAVSTTNEWLLCNWKETKAYVMKKYLKNFRDPNWSQQDLLKAVAAQEVNVAHDLKYYAPDLDDKFYNWCHYYADWLIGHIAWEWATIPNTDNCKDGVIYFLQNGLFYFVNAWHKADVYANCSETKKYMTSGELSSMDRAFMPEYGDFAYFRMSKDDKNYVKTETSYHVGIVTDVERINNGYRVTIAQGNTNGTYNNESCKILTYDPTPNSDNPDLYNDHFNSKLLGFGIGLGRG